MNEYLGHIQNAIIASIAIIAVGWYCYRWGRDDGGAEGYSDGYASGRKEVWADVWNRPAVAKVPPKQDLSGGPREPA